jgi:hypothetical protein
MKNKYKAKGKYVICLEDDGTLYSTDSLFWYDFFHYDEYRKKQGHEK